MRLVPDDASRSHGIQIFLDPKNNFTNKVVFTLRFLISALGSNKTSAPNFQLVFVEVVQENKMACF